METQHESHSSSSRTRSSGRLKRKPFSDLTNAPSSLLKPKPKPKPDPRPAPASDPANPEPVFSSTAGEKENDGDLASSSSTPRKDVGNNDNLDIFTVTRRLVKSRRKDTEKDVEAAPTLSCPPLERNRSIEGNIRLKDHVSTLRKAFSAPRDRTKKRKQQHGSPVKLQKPILPPEFVEKQKAYFAEIDAFELPEEEVSDDGLE